MRKERPPNSLQGYAALQKVPPPLNRATQAAKPSGYGPLRLEPNECGARKWRQRDQSSIQGPVSKTKMSVLVQVKDQSSELLQNRKELEKRHRAYISISQEFMLK